MARFRVVVTDFDYPNLDDEHAVLDPLGADIVEHQAGTEAELIEACRGADAVMCEYAPLTEPVLASMKGVRGVVRWGVGVDNIDVAAATRHAVQVCNVPDFGVDDISDHAIALTLAAVRKIVPMANAVQAGQWDVSAFKPIFPLRGSTLGVIGMGRTGSQVARKAQAFGMRVVAYQPNRAAQFFAERNATPLALDELLSTSDVVSVHASLKPETRHLLGERELGLMKPTAILVNTARGGLIDSAALARALREGRIAGAALDVLEREPAAPDDPLLGAPNCLITPHAAYYSEASFHALKRMAADEVARLLLGQPPRSPVNDVWQRAQTESPPRHEDTKTPRRGRRA
ncbi:MAG TPA: C-terminal binding protein [Chloroflexota bacterium]|nr:C-terminal binding protein [Chloroflexota bacterium]